MAVTTRPSGVSGGGYQNSGCYAPLGVGHSWLAVIGGDTAGFSVTTDGLSWRPANKNIYASRNHTAGVVGSKTVANRLYGLVADPPGGGAGAGVLMRGTYSAASGIITWETEFATGFAGCAPGGGTSSRPRHAGRTIALDEAAGFAYVCSGDGVWRITLSSGASVQRTLNGAKCTGIVLNETDPTIAYVAVESGASGAGVYRCTNMNTGTVATVRKAFTRPNDLQVCTVAGTPYLYVAGMGQGPQRWTVGADITTGWTDLSDGVNLAGNGSAFVDAQYVNEHAYVLLGMTGDASSVNACAVSSDGGTTWLNESDGTVAVSYIPWGETTTWWHLVNHVSAAFDQGSWDTNTAILNPANPTQMILAGRAGAWSSRNGGSLWRPMVQGICATVAYTCSTVPDGGDKAFVGDLDWSCVRLLDNAGFNSGQPSGEQPQVGGGLGTAVKSDGTVAGMALETGEVFLTSNITAADPNWASQGFAGVLYGLAIGEDGSGSQVVLSLRSGAGIVRKVGSGAVSTVAAGPTVGAGYPKFCWPSGATGRAFVYCNAGDGLYRSTNRGSSWTKLFTYSHTEFTGAIHHDPGNLDTLYLTHSGGLYKVTNASGSATLTSIGPSLTKPGPCAVDPNSGVVFVAAVGTDPGGTALYASPSNNPGAATTFVDVSDEQWRAGPFLANDMDCTSTGQLIVSNHGVGYFIAAQTTPSTVVNATAAITQTISPTATASSTVSNTPTVRTLAANTNTTGTGSATTLSVTPTGMVTDDWMLATLVSNGGVATHTGPAGWSLVVASPATTNVNLSVWSKKAGVAEAGPYVFDVGTVTRRIGVIVTAWTGADPSAPVEASNAPATVVSTSFTHASLTPGGANRVWLLSTAKAAVAGATTTLDTPAGFTEHADLCTASATATNVNVSVNTKTVSGATGTQQITTPDNAVNRTWQGIGLLIQGVVGGGVTVVNATAAITQTISPTAAATIVDPAGPSDPGPPDSGPAGGTVLFDGVKRPRITVTAGLGGVLDPGPTYLHLGVGPGLGTGLLAGPGVGVNEIDITADVRSISLSPRGPGSDIDTGDPVVAVLVLSNRHGNYDPSNPASPYYGQLEDGTPIRIRTTWAGVANDRFYGELADITLDLDVTPDATATFTCADGLEKLGRAYLPEQATPLRDGDRSGARINYLADQAAYPSGLRAIDTGYTVVAPTILGDSALELMRKTASTEFGVLYVDGSGVLTFYDRHRGATATRSLGVQATFGDSGSSAIGITSLQLARSRERSFNRVAITRDPVPRPPITVAVGFNVETPDPIDDDPVEQVADNIGAQAAKGVLAFPTEVGQLSRSDGEALALAQYLVGRFADAQNRIREIQVNALRGSWTQLLGLRPLDRVAVVRDYGPATVSAALLVQSIAEEITINPPSWEMTFTTALPPPTPTLFVLGTGRLGSTTIGRLGW